MSPLEPSSAPSSKLQWLAIVLGAGAWAVVAWVIATATQLRPAADDYCQAAAGVSGYLESIGMWYLTWIGDVFQVSVTALLVGQSLANLPLEVSSLIPLLLSALTVALLIVFLLNRASSASRNAKLIGAFITIPALLVLWWAFWWMPVMIDPGHESASWLRATAITDWQVVNVQYVLVPAMLVLAWAFVSTRHRWPQWAALVGIALVGAACGTGGLVFGMSALVFSILFFGVRSWWERKFDLRAVTGTVVFAIASLVGLGFAYFAPGAQLRSELLQPDRPLQSASIPSLIAWVFPRGIYEWLIEIFNVGNLLVVGVTIGMTIALSWVGVMMRSRALLQVSGALVAFSFIIALVSRAGDGFSYPAFWHEVMPRTFIFTAFALIGTAIGTWVLVRAKAALSLGALVTASIAAAISIGVLPVMSGHIEDRLATWQVGAAPAGGAADIEIGWIEECWNRWSDDRPLPSRGN